MSADTMGHISGRVAPLSCFVALFVTANRDKLTHYQAVFRERWAFALD